MRLLGLDISARNTGWSTYEHLGAGKAPRIRCGSWKCAGSDFDICAENLSDHLTEFLKGERERGAAIEYAAIEEPFRVIPRGGRKRNDLFASEPGGAISNSHTMLVLHAMAGSACGILRQFHIPKRMVTPSTWRKSFIGTSKAPASVARDKGSAWLKREVRSAADVLGEKYGFEVPNNDASDAVGIVFWLAANVDHMQAEDDLLQRVA